MCMNVGFRMNKYQWWWLGYSPSQKYLVHQSLDFPNGYIQQVEHLWHPMFWIYSLNLACMLKHDWGTRRSNTSTWCWGSYPKADTRRLQTPWPTWRHPQGLCLGSALAKFLTNWLASPVETLVNCWDLWINHWESMKALLSQKVTRFAPPLHSIDESLDGFYLGISGFFIKGFFIQKSLER